MEIELFIWCKVVFLVNFRIEFFGSCLNMWVLFECYLCDVGGGEIFMCCSFVVNMVFIFFIFVKFFVVI